MSAADHEAAIRATLGPSAYHTLAHLDALVGLLQQAEQRLGEVEGQYRRLEKDWSAANDRNAEYEARDAVAYMNAVAERETRAAEGNNAVTATDSA